MQPGPSRYNLLGLPLNALTRGEMTALVGSAVEGQRGLLMPNLNLHAMYLAMRDERLVEFFHAADYVHADGMSAVWIAKLLRLPLKATHRVTYVDWLPELFEVAQARGWRVFYLGGSAGMVERARANLRTLYPSLRIEMHNGFFDAGLDSATIIKRIHSFGTEVLLVGMGMPRQELWLWEHREELRGLVQLTAGGALGYYSGHLATAPRWVGPAGLEWLFRLAAEPRRLFFRYLIEPWCLAYLVARRTWHGLLKAEGTDTATELRRGSGRRGEENDLKPSGV